MEADLLRSLGGRSPGLGFLRPPVDDGVEPELLVLGVLGEEVDGVLGEEVDDVFEVADDLECGGRVGG